LQHIDKKISKEAYMSSMPVTLVRCFLILLIVFSGPVLSRAEEQPAPAAAQQAPAAPAQGTVIVPTASQAAPGVSDQTKTPSAGQEARIYTIKKGDTLWDISSALLKDPFLWPFIWKANPSITNADLIYPGNKLNIPSMTPIERAMQAPPVEKPAETATSAPTAAPAPAPAAAAAPSQAQKEAEETVAANTLILPEDKPVPVMDKYSMLSAGFVSREEGSDRIVGSLEEKTILGYDDIVRVLINSKEAVKIGDRFVIYQPLDTVHHPVTGRKYGKLTKVLGVLELTEKGEKNHYNARIIVSFDAAGIGNLLAPYEEPKLFYNSAESKQKDLKGYILQVVDGRTINAQTDIVYLDKGTKDGVETGDRFLVYSKESKKPYPRKMVGEVQVFLVKEETATAVVRKSVDTLVRGDAIEFKK
jgi:hypothetical protein